MARNRGIHPQTMPSTTPSARPPTYPMTSNVTDETMSAPMTSAWAKNTLNTASGAGTITVGAMSSFVAHTSHAMNSAHTSTTMSVGPVENAPRRRSAARRSR